MSEYNIIDLKGINKCRRCGERAVRLVLINGFFNIEIKYYCEKHYLEWLKE